jgi:hypothetical protein
MNLYITTKMLFLTFMGKMCKVRSSDTDIQFLKIYSSVTFHQAKS